jgi:tetratricopeptide (TPR) repeat protein
MGCINVQNTQLVRQGFIHLHTLITIAMKILISLSCFFLFLNVALAQTDPENFYSYVEVKLEAGDTLGALKICNQAIAGNYSWESYTAQGVKKYLEKDYTGAITDYERAINNASNYAPAYYLRGQAAEKLGMPQEALDNYSTALNLNPLLGKSYCKRANIYSRIGHLNQALEDLNVALLLHPQAEDALQLRAEVYGRMGEYEHQIKDYNKLNKLKPNSPEVYYLRGLAKAKAGKYQAAIKDFDAAIALKPDLQSAHEQKQLAQMHLRQGNEGDVVLNKK